MPSRNCESSEGIELACVAHGISVFAFASSYPLESQLLRRIGRFGKRSHDAQIYRRAKREVIFATLLQISALSRQGADGVSSRRTARSVFALQCRAGGTHRSVEGLPQEPELLRPGQPAEGDAGRWLSYAGEFLLLPGHPAARG